VLRFSGSLGDPGRTQNSIEGRSHCGVGGAQPQPELEQDCERVLCQLLVIKNKSSVLTYILLCYSFTLIYAVAFIISPVSSKI